MGLPRSTFDDALPAAATTLSDHAGPIVPDRATGLVSDRPDQSWGADPTCRVIPSGFVDVAAILDAWSSRMVGHAFSRSIDARIAVAALKAAIRNPDPAEARGRHCGRNSQYAPDVCRAVLPAQGLPGSMQRRGNRYDNAKV